MKIATTVGRQAILKASRSVLALALLSVSTRAEWRQEFLDPPDFRYDIIHQDNGFTVIHHDEEEAHVEALVVGGVFSSTSAQAQAQETTRRRHEWLPENGASSARFSWQGRVELQGRFVIHSPPGTSSGTATALSECVGFGRAYMTKSGDSRSVPGPGGGLAVKGPEGGVEVNSPSAGNGGGTGFFELAFADGDTKCVEEAIVEKTKFAFVASWADSRFFPPRVGYAEGVVRARARAEERELDACADFTVRPQPARSAMTFPPSPSSGILTQVR